MVWEWESVCRAGDRWLKKKNRWKRGEKAHRYRDWDGKGYLWSPDWVHWRKHKEAANAPGRSPMHCLGCDFWGHEGVLGEGVTEREGKRRSCCPTPPTCSRITRMLPDIHRINKPRVNCVPWDYVPLRHFIKYFRASSMVSHCTCISRNLFLVSQNRRWSSD